MSCESNLWTNEQHATSVVREFFLQEGLPVESEVYALGRYIDLAFFLGDKLYAIEFKMHDWRRASKQARDARLIADYSYICLPRRTVSNELRQVLEELGVGLCFVEPSRGWPLEYAIQAPESNEIWTAARTRVTSRFKGRGK